MSIEFNIPLWAQEEEGNNLYQEAVAAGAAVGSLLFKSSAITFLKKKAEIKVKYKRDIYMIISCIYSI
jgi:hypothetical protein